MKSYREMYRNTHGRDPIDDLPVVIGLVVVVGLIYLVHVVFP